MDGNGPAGGRWVPQVDGKVRMDGNGPDGRKGPTIERYGSDGRHGPTGGRRGPETVLASSILF